MTASLRTVPHETSSNPILEALIELARSAIRNDEEAAARRATLMVVAGGMGGGSIDVTEQGVWIRQHPRSMLDDLTLLWHLRGEPAEYASARGLIAGVCGSTFTDPAAVDSREDEPDPGDRCPVCHAAYEDPD